MPADLADLAALANDPRVTVRRGGTPDPDGRCVVYWMQRAQRATDNPALDVAIHAANELDLPIVTFLGVAAIDPSVNRRHLHFLGQGLADLGDALARRRVGLVLRRQPDHSLLRFASEVRPALLVGDENPLRRMEAWRQTVARELRIPVWTIDADVVVPTRLFEKEQYAARTLRPRIARLLPQFLVRPREPVAKRAWRRPSAVHTLRPEADVVRAIPVDESVGPVTGFHGGTRAGQARLRRFLGTGLPGYATRRNRPELDGTSQLSPYLHFGQLGPRGVALAVQGADAPQEDRDAFLEELIVRRELAINFVRYNPRYDQLDGCEPWALRTLERHARDPRVIELDEDALERAESPDPLWNAAQRQLVHGGWMHGYLRMYWAKKILEWSPSAARAFEIAVRQNDRWLLDGRDPNGYAGIAWAIGGKHDRAWGPERAVFGTVRYMSYASTSRKFDWRAYARRVDETAGATNARAGDQAEG